MRQERAPAPLNIWRNLRTYDGKPRRRAYVLPLPERREWMTESDRRCERLLMQANR